MSKGTGKKAPPESSLQKQGRTELGTFAGKYDEPLSKKMTGARLPVWATEKVDQLPNKTEWVRKVLVEAVERELTDS